MTFGFGVVIDALMIYQKYYKRFLDFAPCTNLRQFQDTPEDSVYLKIITQWFLLYVLYFYFVFHLFRGFWWNIFHLSIIELGRWCSICLVSFELKIWRQSLNYRILNLSLILCILIMWLLKHIINNNWFLFRITMPRISSNVWVLKSSRWAQR